MRIGRRSVLAGAVVAAGAGLASAKPGRAALTAVDVHPSDYPTVEAVRWLGRELERETQGRLSIRLYPGGQLGAETDTVALARYRVIDFCRVTAAALNNAFPMTQALTLPFTFEDEAHMRRVVDGEIGAAIRAGFERRGLIGLCFYDGGARSMYTARRAIHTPRDMHGLKVRVPRSDIFMEMIDAMGANATPIPFGEVFTGLQTHLIDAAENNWSTFESTRQYEVARFWSETEHCHSPDALLFSKARYDLMSRADQDLLRAKAAESVMIMRVLWDAKQAAARRAVLADGVAANAVDRALFIEAAAPMRRRHAQDESLGALMRRIENQT
ncbi:MAG: TRAP transporter substrate-binding protein [Hydrogenophilaceae bacterium]|jgi:tripartite ATP-independent transporter DctP family solute receptor|nr:TRAP transporter substrate-binding protein [Hydrogenophilaceae bacterium]